MIYEGREIEIPELGMTIGRNPDSDIVLSDPLASRQHARIAASDGRWFVADLDSLNGTFLNGERLTGEARWLGSGDGIDAAGERLRFIVDLQEGQAQQPIRMPLKEIS